MLTHLPALVEVGAVLILAFVAGFGWTLGAWLITRLLSRAAT